VKRHLIAVDLVAALDPPLLEVEAAPLDVVFEARPLVGVEILGIHLPGGDSPRVEDAVPAVPVLDGL
jgi:hypothetical protein